MGENGVQYQVRSTYHYLSGALFAYFHTTQNSFETQNKAKSILDQIEITNHFYI